MATGCARGSIYDQEKDQFDHDQSRKMSIASNALTIIDLTETATVTEFSEVQNLSQRNTFTVTSSQCPPPPCKFYKRKAGSRCASTECYQVPRSDPGCIQSIKRNICEQIYASELCPVNGEKEQEDLWASLNHIFLQ